MDPNFLKNAIVYCAGGGRRVNSQPALLRQRLSFSICLFKNILALRLLLYRFQPLEGAVDNVEAEEGCRLATVTRILNKTDSRRPRPRPGFAAAAATAAAAAGATGGPPRPWSMPTTRNPFPFPDSDNEKICTGNNPKTPYAVPTQLVQQQDPWNRLHGTPTLASIRREVWYSEPEVSRDSLDFHLSALYNHHEDLLKDKSQVVLHKETIFDNHGLLKGFEPRQECSPPSPHRPTSRGICVRHWINPVKESIHSIEGAIESPHTAATNSGYSRKKNGGIFYH